MISRKEVNESREKRPRKGNGYLKPRRAHMVLSITVFMTDSVHPTILFLRNHRFRENYERPKTELVKENNLKGTEEIDMNSMSDLGTPEELLKIKIDSTATNSNSANSVR